MGLIHYMTITKEGVPGQNETWRTATGELQVRILSDSIILHVVKGHAGAELIPLFTRSVEQRIREGRRLDWFADYSEMVSYDSQVRIALSQFVNSNKPSLNKLVILVRSRLVAMGVSVANLAVGGRIDAFSDPAGFKRELDKVLSRARGADSLAPR